MEKPTFFKHFVFERFMHILFVVQLIVITHSLLIAHDFPATGYEASIYDSTPHILWFILIISGITGIVFLVIQIRNKQIRDNKLSAVAIFIIYLVYAICLSLLIIRNYTWKLIGDPGAHIGNIKYIIVNGHIPKELFYPVLHILATQLHLVTNINIYTESLLMPLFFGLLYVPFMYLLAKLVLPNRNQIILSFVASTMFVSSSYLDLTPNTLSDLFLPFGLYMCLKSRTLEDPRWNGMFLIIIFLYPLFHPLPTLFIISFILSLNLGGNFLYFLGQKQIVRSETRSQYSKIEKYNWPIVAFLFVWSLTWISNFGVWDITVSNVHILLTEGAKSKLDVAISDLNTARSYNYSLINYFVKLYGSTLIYSVISILSAFVIIKEFKVSFSDKYRDLVKFYGPLMITGLLLCALYMFNFMFGPLRLLFFLTLICTFFVGFFLEWIIKETTKFGNVISNGSLILIIILMSSIFTNGILTLYPSHYTLESNPQTTSMYQTGMATLFEKRNMSMEITGMYVNPYRYSIQMLIPKNETGIIHWKIPVYLQVPYHFGYQNNSSLSDFYRNMNNLYLVITSRDIVVAKDVFPEIANFRWTLNDFAQLNFDKKLDKLYSNGEFDLYYIHTE